MLGLGAEATAAIVGAAVGGGLAFLAQLGVLLFVGRRERRAAAQVVFGELVTNFAEATAATRAGEWPSPSGLPNRAAWETYGVKLLRGRGVERVANIAWAYSRLDDVAWLAGKGILDKKDDHSEVLTSIRLGLLELGELSGLSANELENRGLSTPAVRALRNERRAQYRSGRENRGGPPAFPPGLSP